MNIVQGVLRGNIQFQTSKILHLSAFGVSSSVLDCLQRNFPCNRDFGLIAIAGAVAGLFPAWSSISTIFSGSWSLSAVAAAFWTRRRHRFWFLIVVCCGCYCYCDSDLGFFFAWFAAAEFCLWSSGCGLLLPLHSGSLAW
ncbi:hypothetical protein Q3G72_015077 [Acer saccharum]|nr:hypothetical protein Q3G72_015077 [Acer saccharum]